MRGVRHRQCAQAREALQTLLVDRLDCTRVLVAGTRGYAFTGAATVGGLLAASTWPTTFGGPHGIRRADELPRGRFRGGRASGVARPAVKILHGPTRHNLPGADRRGP
jgi:hypothetical protein